MNIPVQAVIFDLDGVITDTAEYHYEAWKVLAEELGIPFTREFNEELKGISRMESLEKILVLGGKAHDFTEEQKNALADKKNEHYLTLIQNISPADVLPGINEFIAEIEARGLKIGLASASKNALAVLESLGLKDKFHAIVDAKTVLRGKPDPEIFLKAAHLLEVEPGACIGVEDAAAGVEAIKGAGMFAVAIGAQELFANADLVYESTAGLSLEAILPLVR
ncbi:beta-phosphoglucomutase [Paenibacillus elgii]|uniref:beta-phosphoglucomutase n=1 Tax=Paenibacillus elgii TaxID=189691 RepID=UPI0020417EF6|nr:beta-phosphoglucomutase [Paenibacillus elgii]MCM3268671.1 beta-phosphoglucomutase [Paenibacillus elgii]